MPSRLVKMKDSTILLLGGAGVLYLLFRNSSSGTSAPIVGSYGTPFSQPTNGARTAGAAANSLAQQQAASANPLSSILSSLGSVLSGALGRSGGGGGSIGGGSVGGGSSSAAQSSFNSPDTSGQTVFGEGVSGNVFDSSGGSSLTMTNADFSGLGFDTSGIVDNSGSSTDNSNSSSSLDYTGAGDFSGYSDVPATGD